MTDGCTMTLGEDGCARLSGVLTFESVPALYTRALDLIPEDLATVDLSGITAVDSAGLALLLEWQASRQGASGALEFTNAPASLMSLASLAEASELLKIRGRDTADG